MNYFFLFVIFVQILVSAHAWNNLNCPAPRAPDNGLSFIFRNGELVHFRCHPGYVMQGKPVAYCVNSVWTDATPECLPIQKWPLARLENGSHHHNSENYGQETDYKRQLFHWSDNKDRRSSPESVYGDGPRRLPLINGIWPSQDQKQRILVLGPQSTPGPKTFVKEEIDIAKLRQEQHEELKQRHHTTKGDKKKPRNRRKKCKPKHLSSNSTEPAKRVVFFGSSEGDGPSSPALSRTEDQSTKGYTRHKWRHRNERRNNRQRKNSNTNNPSESRFMMSRLSRVDSSGVTPYHATYQLVSSQHSNLAELRRRPESLVNAHDSETRVDMYDASCVEQLYGREVPMIAPQVPNAFVFRYETKKNKNFPFNSYLQVKYRCFKGFEFASARGLYCKEAAWVGEMPRCVARKPINS